MDNKRIRLIELLRNQIPYAGTDLASSPAVVFLTDLAYRVDALYYEAFPPVVPPPLTLTVLSSVPEADETDVASTGTLTVTFDRDVELVGEDWGNAVGVMGYSGQSFSIVDNVLTVTIDPAIPENGQVVMFSVTGGEGTGTDGNSYIAAIDDGGALEEQFFIQFTMAGGG